MDNVFQKNGLPQCIKEWTGPVLGICAGMQLLALHAGGSLIPGEEIGMTEIRAVGNDQIFNGKECFSAWELHKYQVLIPDSCITIADSQSGIQAFRYSDKPWYGMLFHPEVRNEWIIDNYLTLCSQTSSSSQK
jgi:GMP synthase (glutamine-hydrolysing)